MKYVFVAMFLFLSSIFAETTTLMADKGKLLFDDQCTKDRGGKIKLAKLNEKWGVRANMGKWDKKDGFYQSSWEKSMGHTPVMAYVGKFKNIIIEVTFRYNKMERDFDTQCFRIALDNAKLYRGHVLSAWANQNNDFIETGFLLQHISKKKDKTIIEDTLIDKQALKFKQSEWHTAILEVVDEKTIFHMNGNLAYGEHKKISVDKTHFSLTLGKTLHDIKRVRAWEATLKKDWEDKKSDILSSRIEFKSQPHTYKNPLKK